MEDGSRIQKIFFEELAKRKAEDIFTPISMASMLTIEDDYNRVIELVTQSNFSRYPVYDDGIDNISGILHVKDLLKCTPESFNLGSLLRTPFFISENLKLDELYQKFNEKTSNIAIVVDEHGSVRGIITREDIFEEFFGDIYDEFDTPEDELPEPEQVSSRFFIIDARMPLEEINEEFSLNLECENCDTIGGYMIEQLGHVPVVDEALILNEAQIKVTQADGSKLIELSLLLL